MFVGPWTSGPFPFVPPPKLRNNISYCWARFPGSSIKRMNWLIPLGRTKNETLPKTILYRYLPFQDEVPMNRSNGGCRLAWWLRLLANHNQRKFAAELAFSGEVKFALGECWPIGRKKPFILKNDLALVDRNKWLRKRVGGSLLEVLTGVWVERLAVALYPLYLYLELSSHSGPPPTRTSKLYPRSWCLSGSFSMSSLLKAAL